MRHRLQAIELANAGVRLSKTRLAENPNYDGETWKVTSPALQNQTGEVTVSVGKDVVTTVATFPVGKTNRHRIERTYQRK